MGAWGAGLYASDIAADLRALIDILVRLPVADGEIWGLAAREYAAAAENPDDEDHTTFWLVLAHRFAQQGIDCPHSRERALTIIDSGADIEMMRTLDMSESDLRKRQKTLEKTRDEIVRAVTAPKKRGPVMKAPQPFIMDVGDCFAYPTMRHKPINPYLPRKETYDRRPWVQDGWGAAILLERGHAFDYLAWYRLAGIDNMFAHKPAVADMRAGEFGPGLSAGICTPLHFRKMEIERVGSVGIVAGAIERLVPELAHARAPEKQAILGVGIVGNLETGRCDPRGFAGVAVADVIVRA